MNLLKVTNGQTPSAETAELPVAAPRNGPSHQPVTQAAPTGATGANVYRTTQGPNGDAAVRRSIGLMRAHRSVAWNSIATLPLLPFHVAVAQRSVRRG
jgi:hypothetical protein